MNTSPNKTQCGTFVVNSGALRATDPCYEPGIWCSAKINNCKTGKWAAYKIEKEFKRWGTRVCELVAIHDSAAKLDWELDKEADIGVDSGQAGIFDAGKYDQEKNSEDEGEDFYDKVCEITLSKSCAGCLPFGCVSSSGFGDGGYNLYLSKNSNGKVIGVKIIFIEDYSDEEDE